MVIISKITEKNSTPKNNYLLCSTQEITGNHVDDSKTAVTANLAGAMQHHIYGDNGRTNKHTCDMQMKGNIKI